MIWAWIGGGTGLATMIGMVIALFKVRPETRKLKSDGAAVLVNAATANASELSDQVGELITQVRKLWASQNATDARLRVHSRWDDRAIRVLRDSYGVSIEDPPPLHAPEEN